MKPCRLPRPWKADRDSIKKGDDEAPAQDKKPHHFAAPPVLMVAAPWQWDTVFMFTHFGWKAIVGILLANGLYFYFFRKDLAGLQHDFAIEDLKHRIQTELIKRRELEAAFEKIGPEADEALGFEHTIRHKTDEIIQHIKSRLEKDYLPDLLAKGVDADLAREAFDKRFKEIKLQKMRQLIICDVALMLYSAGLEDFSHSTAAHRRSRAALHNAVEVRRVLYMPIYRTIRSYPHIIYRMCLLNHKIRILL